MDVTCMTQSSRLNQFVYLFRKNRRKLGWCVVMLDVTKWEIKRKPIADKLCIRKVLSFLFPRSVSFNPPFFFFLGGGGETAVISEIYLWNVQGARMAGADPFAHAFRSIAVWVPFIESHRVHSYCTSLTTVGSVYTVERPAGGLSRLCKLHEQTAPP